MGSDELGHLEDVITRGHQTFVEVGEALLAIREPRGYRAAGFPTFEEYLRERWGWTRQRGYQLIQSAHVVCGLQGDQLSTQVVIPSEHHARVLTTLAPEELLTLVSQLGNIRSSVCGWRERGAWPGRAADMTE
jgi:hypothetical protein